MCKVPHFGTQVQVKVLSEKSTQVKVKVLFPERMASKNKSKSTFKSTWVLFQVLLLVHFRVVSKLFEGTEGYKQFIAKKMQTLNFKGPFLKKF